MRKYVGISPSIITAGLIGLVIALSCIQYQRTNPFDPVVNPSGDPFHLLSAEDTNKVLLSWNAVDLPAIEKYALYRSIDSTNFLFRDAIQNSSQPAFNDSIVSPDSTYYYRVTLFTNGIESKPSKIVAARPKAGTIKFSSSPDTINFDSSASPKKILIKNIGSATIKKVTLTSTQSWITSITPSEKLLLRPGVSSDFEIAIKPTDPTLVVGWNTGYIRITADGLITRTATVSMFKKGVPQLYATRNGTALDTLDFSLNLNSIQVTLANAGGQILLIKSIKPSNAWITIAPLTDSSLSQGQSVALMVTVNRDSLAFRNAPYPGSLSIESNGGTVIAPVLVRKIENSPLLKVAGDTLKFDSTKSVQQFTIENIGSATMQRCSLTTTQAWISPDPALITGLAAAGSRPVSVTINRSATELRQGWNTGYITIESDGGFASKPVTMYVKGSPVLSLERNNAPVTELDFGLVDSTIQITVKNTGLAALSITAIRRSDAWLSADTITTNIAPGEGRAISVRVNRALLASRIPPYPGSITFESNAPPVTLPVTVKKLDNKPELITQPDTLMKFDTTISTMALTIKNTGNATMVRCTLTTTQPWITITPKVIRSLAAGASSPVEITVNRTHASVVLGWNYGLVALASDGGNRSVAVNAYKKNTDPPPDPALSGGAVTGKSATIIWNKIDHPDLAGYKVYRGNDSNVNLRVTPLHQTANAADTTWTDTTVATLQTYYYRVVAFDAEDKTGKSNVLKVTTTAVNWVSGVVKNAKTNGMVEGVAVTIAGTSQKPEISAADGRYTINNPPVGVDTIVAKKPNYLTNSDTVMLLASGGVTKNLPMLPVPVGVVQLDELTNVDKFSFKKIATDGTYAYALSFSTFIKLDTVYNADGSFGYTTDGTRKHIIVHVAELANPDNPIRVELPDTLVDDPVAILAHNRLLFVTEPEDSMVYKIEDILGTPRTSKVNVHCVPYGLAIDGTSLYVAGKKNFAGTGVIQVINAGSMQISKTIDLLNFGAEYELDLLFGPSIAVNNGIAYIINGAKSGSGIGKIAKVTLATSTVDTMVTLPWAQLSDIAILNDHIYVSSTASNADSLLVFNTALQRQQGIKTGEPGLAGEPGLSLGVCRSGIYSGTIAYTSAKAGVTDTRLLFIDPQLHTEIAGEMIIGPLVRSVAFTPNGSTIVVSTAEKLFKVGL